MRLPTRVTRAKYSGTKFRFESEVEATWDTRFP